MLPAKSKKYDQPDNQPYKKAHPVGYSQLGHKVEICQETDDRYQCQLLPNANTCKDNC